MAAYDEREFGRPMSASERQESEQQRQCDDIERVMLLCQQGMSGQLKGFHWTEPFVGRVLSGEVVGVVEFEIDGHLYELKVREVE